SQGVLLGLVASAGQVSLAPEQLSAGSHAPVDARHVVPAATNWQVAGQQEPGPPLAAPVSPCSPPSPTPLPALAGQLLNEVSSNARPAKWKLTSESRWKTNRTVRPAYALTSAVVTPHPADSFTATVGLPTESAMVPSLHSHTRVGLVPSEFWIST